MTGEVTEVSGLGSTGLQAHVPDPKDSSLDVHEETEKDVQIITI